MTAPSATSAQAGKIIDVALDSGSLMTRSPDIEMERHRAISDLLIENNFHLAEHPDAPGPYHLHLALSALEQRLRIRIHCTRSGHDEEISLPLGGLRKQIHDYVILCDNFYKTARAGEIHRLEAIDAGRRSIHDEGAEMLAEMIENHVILDKLTARRLFSLLYVLHMRGTEVL